MAYAPVAPYVPPFSEDIEVRMSSLAEAISRKADITSEPAYNAVLLIAPDGGVWRLAVDSTGALSTTSVPR